MPGSHDHQIEKLPQLNPPARIAFVIQLVVNHVVPDAACDIQQADARPAERRRAGPFEEPCPRHDRFAAPVHRAGVKLDARFRHGVAEYGQMMVILGDRTAGGEPDVAERHGRVFRPLLRDQDIEVPQDAQPRRRINAFDQPRRALEQHRLDIDRIQGRDNARERVQQQLVALAIEPQDGSEIIADIDRNIVRLLRAPGQRGRNVMTGCWPRSAIPTRHPAVVRLDVVEQAGPQTAANGVECLPAFQAMSSSKSAAAATLP